MIQKPAQTFSHQDELRHLFFTESRSPAFFQLPEMQQVFSHGLIGAQREGELALRPGEAARSLDKPMPQGVEFFKGPGGRPFSPAADW